MARSEGGRLSSALMAVAWASGAAGASGFVAVVVGSLAGWGRIRWLEWTATALLCVFLLAATAAAWFHDDDDPQAAD